MRKNGYVRLENGRSTLSGKASGGASDDDADGDRDQRLTELLPLVPAKEELLHDEPYGANGQGGDDERDDPVAEAGLGRPEGRRRLAAREFRLEFEREEAREHVQRAVRHVDHAH
jgi:hypothetical protein